MYIYLKINQNEKFAYRNLQNWINVAAGMDNVKVIIICDKQEIADTILSICRLIPGTEIISSEREEKVLRDLCEEITEERWRFAGFAHLTTFWHAKQQKDCEAFWNIDADDTYLCLSEERTREALLAVEGNAKREGTQLYSLDMHTTRTEGEHWSFGVTYTDNRIDWISLMQEEISSTEWTVARRVMLDVLHLLNIDMFFTYIMKKQYARNQRSTIRIFYFEHSWFIHYSKDFLGNVFSSGIYQWRYGRLFTPLLSDLLKAGKYMEGQMIPVGVVDKMELSITEDESLWGLQKYIFFGPLAEGRRELINDLPLYETERWKILNESIGYQQQISKENSLKKPYEWREMMNLMDVLYSDGEEIYELLLKSRPPETEIIVCPGHMGDTLLIAALAKEYKKQHGVKRLLYVSSSLPEEILRCYPAIDATLMLEKDEMNSLQFFMMVRKLWYRDGIRYAHFRDDVVLNYPKVATKGIFDYSRYSFRSNRMEMMNLREDTPFDPLCVSSPQNSEQLIQQYGDAVLLMPVSYSTHLIPESFWEKLADAFLKKGYAVYTNYNGARGEEVIKGTKPFKSSFYEMAQMTSMFSLFVGTRSGLCDLISLTGNGTMVILYNETVLGSGGLEIREEEMKESNIYDLGRRNGIFCYRYLSQNEENVIEAICKILSEKKEDKYD